MSVSANPSGPSRYTFGDTGEASARLRRLAALYEPETRDLLVSGVVGSPRLAVDLGCGPGWSTCLLHETLKAARTVGLDASERFIAEARRNQPHLAFEVHDVRRGPLPVAQHGVGPNVLLCRFLLTHLSPIREPLRAWAKSGAPGAMLFIHETESLETTNPSLDRYYELVGEMQRHYGQTLCVGGLLEACVDQAGWKIVESERRILEKPAQQMAELHLPNLRTWRQNDFARKTFDPAEIDALEASLARIVSGEEDAGVVVNAARQIIAQRSATRDL